MEGQAPAENRGERGGRGRGFGKKPDGKGPRKGGLDNWTPRTKLGRLVKHGHITKLEQIYTYSIPIKEAQIVDKLIADNKGSLSDEVMKIVSVQKQTKAGQRTRFKAVVVIGDHAGHVGLGIKLSKEVQISIKGALLGAKLTLVPVRRGYWGNKIGEVHTVPVKTTGKGGSVRFKLTPAPRGTGIVAAPIPKKILQFAGIDDVYTCSSGMTRTSENFIKATYASIAATYKYLTPDLWTKTEIVSSPMTAKADWLQINATEKRPARGGRGGRDGGRGGRGGRGRGFGGRGRGDRAPRQQQ